MSGSVLMQLIVCHIAERLISNTTLSLISRQASV